MARMSVDDSFGRDPRVVRLATLCGWSRRETMGCLFDIWAICYDRITPVLPERDIDIAADLNGFSGHLIGANLGTKVARGVRVSGARVRIKYLKGSEESGREGGIKSGEVRRKKAEANRRDPSKGSEGVGNLSPSVPSPPSVPPSPPVPDLQISDSATLSASPQLAVFVSQVDRIRTDPPKPSRKKPRPGDPTPTELESALTVLAKLTKQNGVDYRGSKADIALIVARLRDGLTEWDLRLIIGYCAIKLDWINKPDQQPYLRPATLFGPKTHGKYLPPARTWGATLDGPSEKQIETPVSFGSSGALDLSQSEPTWWENE